MTGQSQSIQNAYDTGFFKDESKAVFRDQKTTDYLRKALVELRAGRGAI